MMIRIETVLSKDEVATLRERLLSADAAWIDGRATAGYQGAPVKQNRQIDEASPVARAAQAIILSALERRPDFISAALPKAVYPPMFNRYGEGMYFGPHVDGSVRIDPRTGAKLRTDLSATLFLTEPGAYEGGELVVHDTYGRHAAKLGAGDMVLYPATSLHEVTPITRGERLASFFWIQSLVKDPTDRSVLYEMDQAIQQLNQTAADEDARTRLIGCYHNLVRRWAEP